MSVTKRKALEDEVPSYRLEARVSTIDDHDEFVAALKAASKRCQLLMRQR